MDLDERRKLCRSLIDKASLITADEETELSILLLMGLGLSESQAWADVCLRAEQNRAAKKRKIRW